jgi:hypothetical protein
VVYPAGKIPESRHSRTDPESSPGQQWRTFQCRWVPASADMMYFWLFDFCACLLAGSIKLINLSLVTIAEIQDKRIIG